MNKEDEEKIVGPLKDGVHVSELQEGSPEKVASIAAGDAVTKVVHILRTPEHTPNEHINKLMNTVWDLVGQKKIPVGLHPKLNIMSFVVMGKSIDDEDNNVGCILIPIDWIQRLHAKPFFEFGAMVYVGSQARDYHDGLITSTEGSEMAKQRAKAYEAEYLLMVQKDSPDCEFNQYQKDILKEFPRGVKDIIQ